MDYDEMYQKMYDAYHEAADQNDALIADVGKCFYEEATKQDILLKMAVIQMSLDLGLQRR